MRHGMMGAAVVGLMVVGSTMQARGGIILTALEVGSDVVISGGGTANLAGLTSLGTSLVPPAIYPSSPALVTGPYGASNPYTPYGSITGPTSFGTGGTSFANLGTGDVFGINSRSQSQLVLVLPVGYVSNSQLEASMTFLGKTFADLGMTPGTYTWTWGTGADADSFELRIGATAVPEPSSLVLAGIGLGVVLWGMRRRIRPLRV